MTDIAAAIAFAALTWAMFRPHTREEYPINEGRIAMQFVAWIACLLWVLF